MTRLHTPLQAQRMLPQQPQLLGGLTMGPVPLSDWDFYGFGIPKSTIVRWIADAEKNGIMEERAVQRFGQRYFVDPYRLFQGWMPQHSNPTRIERIARADRTNGKRRSKETLQTDKVSPGHPSLTEDEVREIRTQTANTAVKDRNQLYTTLSTKLNHSVSVIRNCAEDRSYKHLPLTTSYRQRRGAKTKESPSQQAETPPAG